MAGVKGAKFISWNRKMQVKECVDRSEGYSDVKSEEDQVTTPQTDFQVLLKYFDIKNSDSY